MILALWSVIILPFVSPQDTVALAEVAVHAAALDRFAAGQTLLTYDKSTLERYAVRSLGDLLQETSPIFVRQYGGRHVGFSFFSRNLPWTHCPLLEWGTYQ